MLCGGGAEGRLGHVTRIRGAAIEHTPANLNNTKLHIFVMQA
jgi:hypothetical protein